MEMHDKTSMVGNSVLQTPVVYKCVQVVLVVRSVKEWHGGRTRPTQDEVRRKEGKDGVVNIKRMMLCYMLIDDDAEGRNRNRAGLRVSSRVRI